MELDLDVVEGRQITSEVTRQDADDFDSVLLDYNAKGRAVELVGTEAVQGITMHRLRVRHLPVVEAGRLLGMVAQRDLLQIDLTAKDEEIRWLNAYVHFIPPAREGTS